MDHPPADIDLDAERSAPSPALAAVARLRGIAAAIETGETPDADDLQWLAGALAAYLDGAARGLTLDAALGVEPRPFGPPWWEVEAIAERERLIAVLAERVLGTSSSGKAKAMATLAERYAGIGWRHERDFAEPPARRSGTAEEVLWHLHKCGAPWPLAWRQILRCLSSATVAMSNISALTSPRPTGDDPDDRRKASPRLGR